MVVMVVGGEFVRPDACHQCITKHTFLSTNIHNVIQVGCDLIRRAGNSCMCFCAQRHVVVVVPAMPPGDL